MASVFAQLFDTPPFVAASHQAMLDTGQHFTALSPKALGRYIKRLNTPTYTQPIPPVPKLGVTTRHGISDSELNSTRLWGWSYNNAKPTELKDIACRVRENGYKAQMVLNRLQYGCMDAANKMQPQVLITTRMGQQLALPLDLAHLYSSWRVTGGYIHPDGHPLWPLEGTQDSGLVLAFAFELLPNVQRPGELMVVPYKASAGDPGEAALARLGNPGLQVKPPANVDPQWNWFYAQQNALTWMETVHVGDFMQSASRGYDITDMRQKVDDRVVWSLPTFDQGGQQPLEPIAVIGGDCLLCGAHFPHILVVCSLALFTERRDYSPGPPWGHVGAARMFPNIIVKSSIGLNKIEATVRLTRPTKTIRLDEGNGTVNHPCCDATDDIGTILMTDSNDHLLPWPAWDSLFAQYAIDPDRTRKEQRIRVVDSSTKVERKIKCSNGKTYLRAARQGEYDNIHIAPRLKMPATKVKLRHYTTEREYDSGTEVALTAAWRDKLHLDDIAMAPFCIHDCFHMHWRWMLNFAQRSQWGWADGVPYAKSGEVMVPDDQDVDLVLHGPADFSYHTIVAPRADKPLKDFYPHIMFHAGCAYACAVGSWREAAANMGMDDVMDETLTLEYNNQGVPVKWRFYRANDAEVNPRTSVAAFYWYLRYRLVDKNDKPFALERSKLTKNDLRLLREQPMTLDEEAESYSNNQHELDRFLQRQMNKLNKDKQEKKK